MPKKGKEAGDLQKPRQAVLRSEGYWDDGGLEVVDKEVRLFRSQPEIQDKLPEDVAVKQQRILESVKGATSTQANDVISKENRQLLEACKSGSPGEVSSALANGADPNLGISFMFKVLHLFERHVSLDIVSRLKAAKEAMDNDEEA
eukprot:m.19426 g.19426  ORF g.19426 m.19426 type:complete len:146 (-) comp6578_c0_seq2:476-913(-)